MTDPQWQVQAAFGKTFRDLGTLVSGDWTDLSVRVRGFTFKRGRQLQSGTMEAGTATIQLSNADRNLDPTNAVGPYYGQLVPMVPVRILAVHASTTYPAFFGYAEQWPVKWTGQYDSIVDLPLTDGLGVLSRQPVGDSLWAVWAQTGTGQVLWWRMSASTANVPNGATVTDWSGHGNDGTVVTPGSTAVSSVASLHSGDTDGALALYTTTAASPYIWRDDGTVGTPAGTFTFAATINVGYLGALSMLATGTNFTIFKQMNTAGTVYGIDIVAQKTSTGTWAVGAALYNTAGTQFAVAFQAVTNVADGNSHTIAVMVGRDPSNLSTGIMYINVDGVQQASSNFGLQGMSQGLCAVGPTPISTGVGAQSYLWSVDEVFLSSVETTINNIDFLDALFGQQTYAPAGMWVNQPAATRVAYWLALAGFNIYAGTSVYTYPSTSTALYGVTAAPSNAMDGIKEATDESQGVFWARRDGSFQFLGFAELSTATRYTTSQATFGRPASTGQIAVDTADPIVSDIDRIINRVSVSITATGGWPSYATTAIDQTSKAQYGEKKLTPTYMPEAQAQAIVTRYAQPKPRFPQVVFEPGFDATATAFVLGSELQDRVTVTAQPPGGGAALTVDAHIQGETWTVNPDKPWQVTYDLDLGL